MQVVVDNVNKAKKVLGGVDSRVGYFAGTTINLFPLGQVITLEVPHTGHCASVLTSGSRAASARWISLATLNGFVHFMQL